MEETTKDQKEKSSWGEVVKYLLIALVIVVPFRIFIAQPYIVSGSSMDPTFKDGDYLIVDQVSKRFELPERESVVIIRYPKNRSKFFIKRLIAFPGEKVEIRNGSVYISNPEEPNGFKVSDSHVVYTKNENFSLTLGDDEYFVMGDNRAGSSDSRIWGPIKKKDIVGSPLIKLLPLSEIELRPGTN